MNSAGWPSVLWTTVYCVLCCADRGTTAPDSAAPAGQPHQPGPPTNIDWVCLSVKAKAVSSLCNTWYPPPASAAALLACCPGAPPSVVLLLAQTQTRPNPTTMQLPIYILLLSCGSSLHPRCPNISHKLDIRPVPRPIPQSEVSNV